MRLMLGDCLERMKEIEDDSVDAVITDPPYPMIKRPYGRMTEAEWHSMMDRLIPECRRVLKPTGSAVFVLQPNSEKVGRMRPWLWKFMAKWAEEWNQIQDAWWWNYCALPEAHSIQGKLMRPSLKACVWLGPPDCYRGQDDVLWSEAETSRARRLADRATGRASTDRLAYPSKQGLTKATMYAAVEKRGGVNPFNVLPVAPDGNRKAAGTKGHAKHSATTPLFLADWWVRYISPPGGVVLDPFVGSGTVALAALARGRSAIGIERDPGYFATAERRIAEAQSAAA